MAGCALSLGASACSCSGLGPNRWILTLTSPLGVAFADFAAVAAARVSSCFRFTVDPRWNLG
jgi:hypothetical protein